MCGVFLLVVDFCVRSVVLCCAGCCFFIGLCVLVVYVFSFVLFFVVFVFLFKIGAVLFAVCIRFFVILLIYVEFMWKLF